MLLLPPPFPPARKKIREKGKQLTESGKVCLVEKVFGFSPGRKGKKVGVITVRSCVVDFPKKKFSLLHCEGKLKLAASAHLTA